MKINFLTPKSKMGFCGSTTANVFLLFMGLTSPLTRLYCQLIHK